MIVLLPVTSKESVLNFLKVFKQVDFEQVDLSTP